MSGLTPTRRGKKTQDRKFYYVSVFTLYNYVYSISHSCIFFFFSYILLCLVSSLMHQLAYFYFL